MQKNKIDIFRWTDPYYEVQHLEVGRAVATIEDYGTFVQGSWYDRDKCNALRVTIKTFDTIAKARKFYENILKIYNDN